MPHSHSTHLKSKHNDRYIGAVKKLFFPKQDVGMNWEFRYPTSAGTAHMALPRGVLPSAWSGGPLGGGGRSRFCIGDFWAGLWQGEVGWGCGALQGTLVQGPEWGEPQRTEHRSCGRETLQGPPCAQRDACDGEGGMRDTLMAWPTPLMD